MEASPIWMIRAGIVVVRNRTDPPAAKYRSAIVVKWHDVPKQPGPILGTASAGLQTLGLERRVASGWPTQSEEITSARLTQRDVALKFEQSQIMTRSAAQNWTKETPSVDACLASTSLAVAFHSLILGSGSEPRKQVRSGLSEQEPGVSEYGQQRGDEARSDEVHRGVACTEVAARAQVDLQSRDRCTPQAR